MPAPSVPAGPGGAGHGGWRGREEEEGYWSTKKKDKKMTKRRSGRHRRDAEPWEPPGRREGLCRPVLRAEAVGESPGARRGPANIA